MAKKLLGLLMTAAMLFTLTSFSAAQGLTGEEQMLQRLREFYADDPNVIDVVMTTDEDGEVYYSPVLAEEDVPYEELMAYLEPLGIAELHDRIAVSANSTEESYEMYLDWVLSIESDLPENVFSYLYRETIALMEEAALMEEYSEEFAEPDMYNINEHLDEIASFENKSCRYCMHQVDHYLCSGSQMEITTVGGDVYLTAISAFCDGVNHASFYTAWTQYPSYHWRVCTSCGYTDKKDHSPSYSYSSNRVHKSVCSVCNYFIGTYACSYTSVIALIYPDSHQKKCTVCYEYGAFSHEYGSWTQKNAQVHTHVCTVCKFAQDETHKLRIAGDVQKCTICGYTTGII